MRARPAPERRTVPYVCERTTTISPWWVGATWCRPCLAEMSKLADVEDRWKADGYRLILVAVATRQTAERLRELASQEPLPGRLVFDANGSVAAAFGAATIPTHALVDRHGRIVARSGVLDAAFKQAVERLVRQEGRVKP